MAGGGCQDVACRGGKYPGALERSGGTAVALPLFRPLMNDVPSYTPPDSPRRPADTRA